MQAIKLKYKPLRLVQAMRAKIQAIEADLKAIKAQVDLYKLEGLMLFLHPQLWFSGCLPRLLGILPFSSIHSFTHIILQEGKGGIQLFRCHLH